MDHSSSSSVTFFRAISKYVIVILELMTQFIKTTFEHFRQKMRHHISTLYAAMNVPEPERSYFYCLMGHSADINTNVYQKPLSQKKLQMCAFSLLWIPMCFLRILIRIPLKVTLKPGVWSLKMVPFDRSYMTVYWSAIVNIAVSCTVFELFNIL